MLVPRPQSLHLQILNSGVLVIPREQAGFLERVYQGWRDRKNAAPKSAFQSKDPFVRAADQPHVSYALQVEGRYRDFGVRSNTLWWHWYRQQVSPRQMPFLLRSKAAALTIDRLPRALWRAVFRRERATFARALSDSDFLHVAGSKVLPLPRRRLLPMSAMWLTRLRVRLKNALPRHSLPYRLGHFCYQLLVKFRIASQKTIRPASLARTRSSSMKKRCRCARFFPKKFST